MQNDIVKRPLPPPVRPAPLSEAPASAPAVPVVVQNAEPAPVPAEPPVHQNPNEPVPQPTAEPVAPADGSIVPAPAQQASDLHQASDVNTDVQPEEQADTAEAVVAQPQGPTAPIGIIMLAIVVCLSLAGLAVYAGMQTN